MADVFSVTASLTMDTSDYEKSLDSASGKTSAMDVALGNLAAQGISKAVSGLKNLATSSIKTGMDFDSSMSQVAATMGVTTDEIQDLRDYALEMGSTTAFSATEAADALNYMALAGYDADTSMEMLPNVLNLAAAGGMELAAASDMVTDTQTALGLSLEETNTLVDQMAETSSSSNTSVSQLGEALLTVGGTAKELPGGITEMNTVLGVLADNGIKGSEAGTHLRNMILSLEAPTDTAAEALDALGVSVFDSQGDMRSLQDIMSDLNVSMEDMTAGEKTEIISTIFNKTDIASVNALLATTDERWDELGAAIEDSTGAAQQMADTQLDNLSGDVTILQSAWEGLQITLSDLASGSLSDVVQGLTDLVTTITDLVSGNITLAEAFGISEGAMAVIVGIVAGLATAFAVYEAAQIATTIATSAMTVAQKALNLVMNANPIGLVVIAIAALAAGLVYAYNHCETFRNIVQGAWDAIKTACQAAWDNVIEPILGWFRDRIDDVGAAFSALKDAGEALKEGIINAFNSIWDAISDVFESALEIGDNIISGIKQGVTNAWSTFTNIVNDIVSAIAGWVSSVLNSAKEVGRNIINGIKQGVTNVWNTFTNIVNNIVSAIAGWVSKVLNSAKAIGKGLIDGIKQGFSNAWSTFTSWITGKLSGLVDTVLGFFGIHSPSRVFAEIGSNLVEGMEVGFGDEFNAFSDDAISDLSSFVTDANEVLSGVGLNEISYADSGIGSLESAYGNAAVAGLTAQSQSAAGTTTIHTQVNIGGTKLGEIIYTLYNQQARIAGQPVFVYT